MDDLNKVIRGLECCTADLMEYHQDHFCDMCPYKSTDPRITYCFNKRDLMRDALSLLKTQEPVHVKYLKMNYGKYLMPVCGNCGEQIREDWKSCPVCGKAVKWNG